MILHLGADKNIFSNIIKNIPPEDYKEFKIEYDQSNDISISEIDSIQIYAIALQKVSLTDKQSLKTVS